MKKLSAIVCAGIAAAVIGVSAQTNGIPERFTAMAVNMNNGGSGTIELVVERWSMDKDRTQLMTTLLDKGPDKLLDVLQRMPRVGYIRSNGGLGYDLHYAHKTMG